MHKPVGALHGSHDIVQSPGELLSLNLLQQAEIEYQRTRASLHLLMIAVDHLLHFRLHARDLVLQDPDPFFGLR